MRTRALTTLLGTATLTAAAFVTVASGVTASAQASTVRPAIATNCTYTVVQSGGAGAWGYATCTDAPTSHWQLVIDCIDYRDRTHITYGHVTEGSGTSAASCTGPTDYFTWDHINNID